jgi:hypothetical protein
MAGIRAEYWIECDKCNREEVIVERHPVTRRMPKTKGEAWETAKANGWAGSSSGPVCPNCKHK